MKDNKIQLAREKEKANAKKKKTKKERVRGDDLFSLWCCYLEASIFSWTVEREKEKSHKTSVPLGKNAINPTTNHNHSFQWPG